MLQCRNLKVSFLCKRDINIQFADKCIISRCRISIILRHPGLGCVFTIYNHSLKTLHCTGIKEIEVIPKIKNFIKYELYNETLDFNIDNSLFTCKQSLPISLTTVIERIDKSKNPLYYCTRSTELFPALFLKTIQKKIGYPTVILFHNSSYVLIGGKTIDKVKTADLFVKSITKL